MRGLRLGQSTVLILQCRPLAQDGFQLLLSRPPSIFELALSLPISWQQAPPLPLSFHFATSGFPLLLRLTHPLVGIACQVVELPQAGRPGVSVTQDLCPGEREGPLRGFFLLRICRMAFNLHAT